MEELNEKEIHNLISSTNIIRVIISKRIKFKLQSSGLWYHVVQCHNPGGCNMNLYCHENFKSCTRRI